MRYIFDTNSLSNILNHYYYDRFQTFWQRVDDLVEKQRAVSVKEVQRELLERFEKGKISIFMNRNEHFFPQPEVEELDFISDIYKVRHFENNLSRKKRMRGGPFADPFVIAKAKCQNAVVVTEEKFRERGTSIPNICKHFNIKFTNLEGLMANENWVF